MPNIEPVKSLDDQLIIDTPVTPPIVHRKFKNKGVTDLTKFLLGLLFMLFVVQLAQAFVPLGCVSHSGSGSPACGSTITIPPGNYRLFATMSSSKTETAAVALGNQLVVGFYHGSTLIAQDNYWTSNSAGASFALTKSMVYKVNADFASTMKVCTDITTTNVYSYSTLCLSTETSFISWVSLQKIANQTVPTSLTGSGRLPINIVEINSSPTVPLVAGFLPVMGGSSATLKDYPVHINVEKIADVDTASGTTPGAMPITKSSDSIPIDLKKIDSAAVASTIPGALPVAGTSSLLNPDLPIWVNLEKINDHSIETTNGQMPVTSYGNSVDINIKTLNSVNLGNESLPITIAKIGNTPVDVLLPVTNIIQNANLNSTSNSTVLLRDSQYFKLVYTSDSQKTYTVEDPVTADCNYNSDTVTTDQLTFNLHNISNIRVVMHGDFSGFVYSNRVDPIKNSAGTYVTLRGHLADWCGQFSFMLREVGSSLMHIWATGDVNCHNTEYTVNLNLDVDPTKSYSYYFDVPKPRAGINWIVDPRTGFTTDQDCAHAEWKYDLQIYIDQTQEMNLLEIRGYKPIAKQIRDEITGTVETAIGTVEYVGDQVVSTLNPQPVTGGTSSSNGYVSRLTETGPIQEYYQPYDFGVQAKLDRRKHNKYGEKLPP